MAAEGSATDRLLILACSQRKRPDAELLPALERYDGPAFRVLRRFLRSRAPDPPDVLILSAEHGLIPRDLPIAAYDRKMTPARARGKVRRCYVQFPVFEEPAETVMSVVESLAHQLSNTQKEMFPDIFKAAEGDRLRQTLRGAAGSIFRRGGCIQCRAAALGLGPHR
jgi:hypothetical protein